MDTREARAYPAERPIALAARKFMPTHRFVAAAPRRSLRDTRRGPRVSVPIGDPTGDCRDRLRAYPRRLATGLLLESPWILGDCERDDRISTSGGYAPPRGLLVVRQTNNELLMQDTPKRLKRLVREWAAVAHDRELSKALLDLRAHFEAWQRGDITAADLNDLIHQFHQAGSREIWKNTRRIIWSRRLGLPWRPEFFSGRRSLQSFCSTSRA